MHNVCMAIMLGVFTDLYFALYTNICSFLGNTDFLNNLCICTGLLSFYGAHGGALGWGTALEPGRSQVRYLTVSLEFLIYVILPAALWPWVNSASNKDEYRETSWG
jgi:hypothetical protein